MKRRRSDQQDECERDFADHDQRAGLVLTKSGAGARDIECRREAKQYTGDE